MNLISQQVHHAYIKSNIISRKNTFSTGLIIKHHVAEMEEAIEFASKNPLFPPKLDCGRKLVNRSRLSHDFSTLPREIIALIYSHINWDLWLLANCTSLSLNSYLQRKFWKKLFIFIASTFRLRPFTVLFYYNRIYGKMLHYTIYLSLTKGSGCDYDAKSNHETDIFSKAKDRS